MANKSITSSSPLMVIFVITVLLIAGCFVQCHKNYLSMKYDQALEGKTETEQVEILKNQIKENSYAEYNMIDDEDTKGDLLRSRAYVLEDNTLDLAVILVVIFFVLCALAIGVFKYVAIIVLGLKSLKNIKRNM